MSAGEAQWEPLGLSHLFPPYGRWLREENPGPLAALERSQAWPRLWDETLAQGLGGKIQCTTGGMGRALVKNGAPEQPEQPHLLCLGTPPRCQPANAVRSRADGQKSTQYVVVWICSPLRFLTR